MSVERLLDSGKIHPFKATQDEIDKAIEITHRDLALGEKVLKEDLDWGLAISYNSVLQICRAYMLSAGYRPASVESHKTVFEFMSLTVEPSEKGIIEYFDRVRRKRHRTIYNEVGLVTQKEAEEILRKARSFIASTERKIKR